MKKVSGTRRYLMLSLSFASVLLLSACGISERVSNIGKAPSMSGIQTAQNSANNPELIKLPMPSEPVANTNANSLWQPGRQTFFKDQRAHKVGDILTVNIDIADEADMQNKTERQRTGTEQAGLPNLAGFEGYLGKVLPGGVDPSNLVGMNTNSTSTGDGKIKREEEIRLKLAAMITQVLPNGNFIIRGQQEVRVNYELRELTLDGVIRPEDILNNNSISYEKIAEARISYGGRGQVSEIQQPRYGQQFIDAVFPF
ncbi:MAG: flagellar basal body L-ring protein FlgH [Alphaproteobacteria bacterium]|nr:flagellar basal body L-ring protein FlgH [Alphaproteobacteria bacterium]